MNRIDKNEFLINVSLALNSNLKIEKALFNCWKSLKLYIPLDKIYLELYESEVNSMRIIAEADKHEGKAIDVMVPLPAVAYSQHTKVEESVKSDPTSLAFLLNRSEDHEVAYTLQKLMDLPKCSIISLPVAIENKPLTAIVIVAFGYNKFTEEQKELISLLRDPFSLAISNALQHREVIELTNLLSAHNRFLHKELQRFSGEEIIGSDFGLKGVMNKVRQVASLESPVLLLGETGTGKDIVASAIHSQSMRSNNAFISVNCGAIPDNLIDSELFGHEKGAFTGAISQKLGKFERANKGTIFLDEIGELPLQAQVRLLTVLQSKEIERVGGTKTIKLDIRIIAATNRNLEEMIKLNQFREDLWFRLNVFPISIPPLRDRRLDIPALLQHFVKQKAQELKLTTIPTISPGTIDALTEYNWPGNVRELQNIVERALILSPSGPLDFSYMNLISQKGKKTSGNISENLDEVTIQHIRKILLKTKGKINGKGGAAELLGIHPNTLRNKMSKLEIEFRKKEINYD